ncbi:hypothetical protein GCM10009762_17740 [Dermacoccus barathri]|uniref:Uncharacterized protein n=1 Tax=Dermacoccus barathri TaxID=322601 RepID=A0ABN2BQT5_9MICO
MRLSGEISRDGAFVRSTSTCVAPCSRAVSIGTFSLMPPSMYNSPSISTGGPPNTGRRAVARMAFCRLALSRIVFARSTDSPVAAAVAMG